MISDEKSRYKSWGTLKKQMNDLLCDSLKDKISYFSTSYHEVHNAYGRATIRCGRKEMAAFSWVEMYKREQDAALRYRNGEQVSYEKLEKEKWMPECTLCETDFIQSVTIYLKTDISICLHSDNYLLRVFAYLDRRVGKRTLVKIRDEVENLPEWVKQFYELRCEADGIVFPPERGTDESVVKPERRDHVHEMKLHASPFEKIKNGEKTIELRLLDEKRQKINEGDSIIFTNTSNGEKMSAEVKKLHCFESFEGLYRSLPLLRCGYTEEDIDSAHPSDMEAYYSAEEQKKYGVVGIELCRVQGKASL